MPYSIHVREEGRGNPTIRRFDTLMEAQAYVKAQWQGVEYVDSPVRFHSDYCTFDVYGFTMKDLGQRMGPAGTQEFWDWEWHSLEGGQ